MDWNLRFWRISWRRGWPSSSRIPAPDNSARWNLTLALPSKLHRHPVSSPKMEYLIDKPVKWRRKVLEQKLLKVFFLEGMVMQVFMSISCLKRFFKPRVVKLQSTTLLNISEFFVSWTNNLERKALNILKSLQELFKAFLGVHTLLSPRCFFRVSISKPYCGIASVE